MTGYRSSCTVLFFLRRLFTLVKTPTFTKKYLIRNEVLNAVTHGIGVLLSIAGLVLLLMKGSQSGSTIELASYIVYGSSLILLYLCSTLYHSLSFTRVRRLFKIFDHSSIYVLIAGTYTPYYLVTIGGTLGWTMFSIVWVIALSGIIFKSVAVEKFPNVSTLVYIGMGLLCVFTFKPLYEGLGTNGLYLLVAGGAAYIIGTIFYSLRNVKYMHVVWHLFVLLGTGLMFLSILFYV
ncbi:hemolysin III family protein [Desemzia sp. FAM 23991]|uniref:PAQR family membrane homeostasis protein TrhA n=1 Tax=unclassified Desemzia TaxID=2685243 RepID=UPI0038858405